ncbi:hypothetical protein Tco_0897825, partial [Tanacetum coccineum]
ETVIKEWEDRMERAVTTASSLEAEQDNGNINRTQSMATLNESFPQGTDSGSGPRCQDTILGVQKLKFDLRLHLNKSYDPPLLRVNTLGINAAKHNLLLPVLVYAARHSLTAVRHKLMLPDITSYCWATAKAKTVNGERQIQALVDKKKVIITEKSVRSDLILEDAEGIELLKLQLGMNLVALWHLLSSVLLQTKNLSFPSIFDHMMKNLEGGVKFLMYLRITPLFQTMIVQAPEDTGEDSAAPTNSYSTPIITQPSSSKPQKKKSKRKQRKDNEEAKTAQAKEIASLKKRVKQLEKRKKSRTSGLKRLRKLLLPVYTTVDELTLAQTLIEIKAAKPKAVTTSATTITTAIASTRPKAKRKFRVAIIEELDSIQAMIEADEKLAARLQAEEQEQFSIEEKSRMLVEMIAERKKLFATQRAAKQRSKLPTKTQIRNRMCAYLKNMDERVEAEKDDDQEEAEMKRHIKIVKDEVVAIDAIPLATKPPMIVEYKIDKDGRTGYFKLIRAGLEEEKARRRGKVFNWETAKYGKIWYDEDVHNLKSIETEFPAIVFNDTLMSEPTVSSLNNEIDFRVSFDDFDDEDYTVIFDKNSFSYKKNSTNDLKTDSENDNEKVNLPSPEPTVSCFDDLEFFKDFENEFPAIVYNNAQTSKSDLLTEPILNPQHIDEFNLKDETSLSECDEEEQNVLNFNDLFPFNVIYPNDSKSDKDNDDDKNRY